ncbi:MAG: beta-galactosidase [Phycisphaerae bacterium]
MALALAAVLFSAQPAPAHYQTLNFDITRNDAQAYTTNIPADAFTPKGIRLDVKKGAQFTLTSNRAYDCEFDYDLQIEWANRSEAGRITIEIFLVNDQARRKAVCTYVNSPSLKVDHDRASISYYKDGKPSNTRADNSTTIASGSSTDKLGSWEWLRIHKALTRVFFLQKARGAAYGWSWCNYPFPDYFGEDCESFQFGFTVRCEDNASATLLIKSMRLSGANVLPRDKTRRTFLFDFGPVNQELEDEFIGISEYTDYSPAQGYGWVIPEREKVVYGRNYFPSLNDKAIAEAGLPPIPPVDPGGENWYQAFLRTANWMEVNDKKCFSSFSAGWDYIEFWKKALDLKTPLERDAVGMSRPFHFGANHLYQKDVEERRGSLYIDDDLSGDFVVDLPNGNYNVILGVGYNGLPFGGTLAMGVDINGRVRKQDLGSDYARSHQYQLRNILVTDGKMDFRFFANVRKAMDPYQNDKLNLGWQINYLLILPAEEKELMNEWEWKIIKRRGEIIRRVTFVQGDPAQVRNEPLSADTKANFLSLNGKPFYYHKLQYNHVKGDTDYVSLYCLANMLTSSHRTAGSDHFFKPDWEKLSYSDDYPWQVVDEMNVAYTWRCLASLLQHDVLSFVPHAVQGEGTPTMDARGRRNPYNIQPPLNSALGREIQREAFTMISNQLGAHPDKLDNYIYEELWHPDDQGYDDQSLIQYWSWLGRKYGDIDALNKEWKRSYKAFEDVLPPEPYKKEFFEFDPEWTNFRKFRSWAQQQTVKSACELCKTLEPNIITWGAKGDFGTQSWYTGEFLDDFGWYSPEVAASVARHFQKSAVVGGCMLNCEYAYVDGRRQFDHKPGPRQYLGLGEVNTVYNKLITSVFKGTKGFYSEWYSDAMCHSFHRTQMIKKLAPQYKIIRWTGELAFYEPGAFEGPPVNMERQAIYASAANQMLYRLAPLWLPAQPLLPRVLVPTVETSFFLEFIGPRPFADFEEMAMRPLRAANIPADFMNLPATKDLTPYKLIIMGDCCQAISKADAQRIRQFVADGGKLILMNGGGFSYDELPRRYGNKDEVYPLQEFADLGGYNIVMSNRWHMPLGKLSASFAANDLAPEFTEGQAVGEWNTNFYYTASEGSRVFIKGTLKPPQGAAKDVAVGIINKAGNVAVIQMPPKGASDTEARKATGEASGKGDEPAHLVSRFFRKLLNKWAIDDRVHVAGPDDEWDTYAGLMEGNGYWLACACNRSDKPMKMSLRIKLPPGDYTVEDVTGDKPDLRKKADGGIRLASDPANRRPKIDYTLSAQQLADGAITADIAPIQGRVYLIRPAAQKVWVSIWRPSLASFIARPVVIAYGRDAADKSAADTIAAALTKVGIKPTLMPAADVKLKKLHQEVRVKPDGNSISYQETMDKWYVVDVFDNEVVDCEAMTPASPNIIIVGSEDTNSLLKHLGTDGAFAYDKVLEKVNSAFPGPGRGIIGTVESINSATYDPRSQSRDAIFVGGSDAAGTTAAADELAALIARYCKDGPRPTTLPTRRIGPSAPATGPAATEPAAD